MDGELGSSRSGGTRSQAPARHAFYIVGKYLRLLSVYTLFKSLTSANVSISVFMFFSLLVSALAFLVFQRPWLGRPLTKTQIYPTILNGGIYALALVCWGKSLAICGPVRTVLAEYTGAVLGAASTLALGRGGHKLQKAGGLVAMLIAFYLLSRGWATASFSPFSHSNDINKVNEEGPVDLGSMSMAIVAGTLLALRRLIARRVSPKSLTKKRLHAITVASAACFLFPLAVFDMFFGEATQEGSLTWPYITMVVFGLIMAFYVDNYAEDRLHIRATSPVHLLVTSALLIILELLYQMDFSFVGFLVCTSILGLGIFEATSSERVSSLHSEIITTS